MMDVELNAFEVLAIAEKIERNGVKFYLRAAELVGESRLRESLLGLATWEAKHIEVFKEMKERLTRQKWELGTFKPSRLDLSEAEVMAGLAVFAIQPDPANELTGNESREEIFKMAIQKERDSIVYYAGLKDFVPAAADKAIVESVIKEEMRHIRILNQSLQW
jgi:rubrerythrin